jgi:hypothetical protein
MSCARPTSIVIATVRTHAMHACMWHSSSSVSSRSLQLFTLLYTRYSCLLRTECLVLAAMYCWDWHKHIQLQPKSMRNNEQLWIWTLQMCIKCVLHCRNCRLLIVLTPVAICPVLNSSSNRVKDVCSPWWTYKSANWLSLSTASVMVDPITATAK